MSLGLISFLLTLAISGAIGLGMQAFGLARNPWMIALILSTTSLGVVLPCSRKPVFPPGATGRRC